METNWNGRHSVDNRDKLLIDTDDRIPAIDEYNKGFVLSDSTGTMIVELVEIIGSGGSCLAYKGTKKASDVTGIPRACVIKEYYPISRDDFISNIEYSRDKVGEEIRLNVKDVDVPEIVEVRRAELNRQTENIRREMETSRELSFDEKNINNSPYVYAVEDCILSKGDSSYMIIDTGEGITLRNFINNYERTEKNLEQRIHLFEQILEAVRSLIIDRSNKKIYCHGDIKPENIFLAGMNLEANIFVARPMILDFGSVFCYDQYQIELEGLSEEAVYRAAEMIAQNDGLGCSSNNYRSDKMFNLARAKQNYMAQRNVEYARNLVEAINDIDLTVDLHSVMQIFIELMIGKTWPSVGSVSQRKLRETTGYSSDIIDFIRRVGRKIQMNEYDNVAIILSDIDELKSLVKNEANPNVLIRELKKQFSWIKETDIDENIFGDLK